MNKCNAKDYLPLVQAWSEDKEIQRRINGTFWDDVVETDFSYPATEYRIKPEPRKAWVWWPDPGKLDAPTAFWSGSYAQHFVSKHGGHITEVTE